MHGRSDAPAGRHESIWLARTPPTDYDPLDGDRRVDVAVVGGGIAGVTTAAKLAESDLTVALLERDRIVAAVTGHTTAKLTALHGLPYARLERRFDTGTAADYASANQAAIDDVAATVDALDVDCGFRRATAYTYVANERDRRRVRDEVDVARRVGLDAEFHESVDLPVEAAAAVGLADQAYFDPRRYLLALAAEIPGDGSDVFEETTVTDVSGGEPCTVETDRGTVRADDVVVASHFPVADPAAYFARMRPKRSYVLAVELAGDPPTGMYYREGSPYFSVRPYPGGDGPTALFGGQDHRTGSGEAAERYRALERSVRDRFDVVDVAYRWSTQDYVSVDGVPFVGPLRPGADHLYVATGFGGWGMTNGTAAGVLLADLVRGRSNDWTDLYDPSRLALRASAGDLLDHNVHAASHLVRDRLSRRPSLDGVDLDPGESEIYRADGTPVAVARDDDGTLHAVSAICTHMGCLVHWNDAERSWDCPCHGSRFDADGTVLDTPAVENLRRFDLERGRFEPRRSGPPSDDAD